MFNIKTVSRYNSVMGLLLGHISLGLYTQNPLPGSLFMIQFHVIVAKPEIATDTRHVEDQSISAKTLVPPL